MSRLPDFGQMEWTLPRIEGARPAGQKGWMTPEGIQGRAVL